MYSLRMRLTAIVPVLFLLLHNGPSSQAGLIADRFGNVQDVGGAGLVTDNNFNVSEGRTPPSRSFFRFTTNLNPSLVASSFTMTFSNADNVSGIFSIFGVSDFLLPATDSITPEGLDLFTNLSTGTLFASTGLLPATFTAGNPVSLSFNQDGLDALTSAVNLGQSVLLGGTFTPTSSSTGELFSSSNFSFAPSFTTPPSSPAAVPEPASLAFLGLIGSVAGFRSIRRAKKKVVGA